MAGLATSPEDILQFLSGCSAEGRDAVLVTLVAIDGASPRAIGAQMAVASNGDYIGSLSGGCIEAAIAAEALEALASRSPRRVRFGRGSPFLDIRLPCGGGIDLLFTPNPDPRAIAEISARLARRRPGGLLLSISGVRAVEADGPSGWRPEGFFLLYTPDLRVVAIGQGEELTATSRLAHAFGAPILAFSPSQRDVGMLLADGIAAERLEVLSARPRFESDPWTAIVFLFHDRDWEQALIPWALDLPSLYIGALGSRRSHAVRKDMLDAAGVSSAAIQRLRWPVGLIPSTREPSALAASILAEIVQDYASDRALALTPARTATLAIPPAA
jgi:xanthine dehydrogenase accessory factor